MSCAQREAALNELVDGRLARAERRALAAHVEACAECALQVRWLRAMKAAVERGPAPAMPADLKASLLARARSVDRETAARRRRELFAAALGWLTGRGTAFGLAAGLAAAVVALVLRVGAPGETVALDDMLAAHRAYALTMPLTSQETVLAGLADALAGERP